MLAVRSHSPIGKLRVRGVTGEVVLRDVWAIMRRAVVVVDDGDVTGKATTREHLGGRRSSGTGADNYDFTQSRLWTNSWIRRGERITLDLLTDVDPAVVTLDSPTANRIELRRVQR